VVLRLQRLSGVTGSELGHISQSQRTFNPRVGGFPQT
jgi:hypothetical protein